MKQKLIVARKKGLSTLSCARGCFCLLQEVRKKHTGFSDQKDVFLQMVRLLSLSSPWGEFSVLLPALRWATAAHRKVHSQFKNIFKPSNLKAWLSAIVITIN